VAAPRTKNSEIKAAEAESLQQETQLKSELALKLQNARAAATETIRKAREDRDTKVAAAQAERDEALNTLQGLQKQVLEKEAKVTAVEAERQQAHNEVAKYRKWAQAQLAEAKKKVQQAMQLAQAASSMAGVKLDDQLSPNNLESTINAANAVSKQLEDQVAAAVPGTASAN